MKPLDKCCFLSFDKIYMVYRIFYFLLYNPVNPVKKTIW